MEKFSFFNDVDNDRIYFAEDFARHLAKYFTNGIFNNELQVVANNNMTITIKPGDANIEGYRYTNTENIIKSIDTADGVLKRIDNVVIRLDLTNRLISAQIIKGAYSNNPIAPTIVRSSTIYDLKIAEVFVENGITSITQSSIKDTRYNNDVCGIVASTIKTLDTKDLFLQYDSEFHEWFSGVKEILTSTPTGNLQNILDSILKTLGLNVNTYLDSKTYSVDDIVIYNNKIYVCKTAITEPEEWNDSKWEFIPFLVEESEENI